MFAFEHPDHPAAVILGRQHARSRVNYHDGFLGTRRADSDKRLIQLVLEPSLSSRQDAFDTIVKNNKDSLAGLIVLPYVATQSPLEGVLVKILVGTSILSRLSANCVLTAHGGGADGELRVDADFCLVCVDLTYLEKCKAAGKAKVLIVLSCGLNLRTCAVVFLLTALVGKHCNQLVQLGNSLGIRRAIIFTEGGGVAADYALADATRIASVYAGYKEGLKHALSLGVTPFSTTHVTWRVLDLKKRTVISSPPDQLHDGCPACPKCGSILVAKTSDHSFRCFDKKCRHRFSLGGPKRKADDEDGVNPKRQRIDSLPSTRCVSC